MSTMLQKTSVKNFKLKTQEHKLFTIVTQAMCASEINTGLLNKDNWFKRAHSLYMLGTK